MNLFVAGFGIHLKDYELAGPSDTTTFRMSGNFGTEFDFFSEALSFGIAYQPIEPLALGLTLESYNVSAEANGYINKYGWMKLSYDPTTYYFNDPFQGFNNSLLDTLKGSFHGKSVGIKLGSSYQFTEKSEVALTIYIPFTIHTLVMPGIFD